MEVLAQMIKELMPKSLFYFPSEQVTNHSDQFMTSEIIREKLVRLSEKEIPYSLAVTLIEFRKKKRIVYISAVIWVEKVKKELLLGNMVKNLKGLV